MAHNALLDVRNSVVQAVEGFLQEPAIKKKYGIPIDSLSLISFAGAEAVDPRSSWIPIPSDEDETRPSGITNEELREFEERLDKLFQDRNLYPSDIPRRLQGSERDHNILFLCPTHHRLFDTCMLSREEWDKIDWGRKSKKLQIYAEKVLKVAHGHFWEKVEKGIYKKRNSEELDVHELRRLYREHAEDIEKEDATNNSSGIPFLRHH